MKGLFEYVYHSTIERNCIEVTKGLLLKVSVYEDGQETPLITSWLGCQRFNKLSSCRTYVTSCCKPWYFLFELSYQMLCLFFKAQLQVSINLGHVWFCWLYLMTILSTKQWKSCSLAHCCNWVYEWTHSHAHVFKNHS